MPFMSLDELERQYGVAPQQQPQQPPPRRDVAALPGEVQTNDSGISEFGKGFRAGWQGWTGNYTRNAAMAAELSGNQKAADGLNKAADGAVTTGPRVQSAFDIGSMQDAGDYVAGTAGQAMASVAQMGTMSAIGGLLGAGVAGKGGFRIGATLGGLADSILQQAGANLAKQQASEEARKADKWARAKAAYGTGAVQGSLDYVTDRMLLGKVFNPAKGAIRGSGFNQAVKYFSGEVAKDMGKEAVTEGAQELMGQAQNKALGDTTPYNWREVADNAVAGAVGGGMMGAPGSLRNTLAAKTPDGSMVDRVAGKVNEYTDALKQRFTDLGAEAGKAAADPAGAAEAATQATKDKFTEWADMAQGTAAGKFTKDMLDSFTGAYRKKAEEVAKAAQEQAKANPEQAKSTYQQASETLRNLWHDSKRTVMDLYDNLRTEKQTDEDGEQHNVYEGTARRTDKPQQQQGTGRVFDGELLPTEPQQGSGRVFEGELLPTEPTQGEPTRAAQPAEMEQEAPSPDAAQGATAGFSFNEDNDAGLTAFLARPDAMRQSLAEAAQARLKGADPRIAQVDTTSRRGQALLQELSRRDKAGEPLDFDSVLQAVDAQVGSKPGEKQYSLLRDSYDNFQFMNNRLQGDAVKQIPAERRQEVLSGVEEMIRSGKLLQSEDGVQLLEGLFGPNADEVLQYVRRERTDTADNGVAALDDDGVSVAGVEGVADERDDAAAFDEDMGGTGDTVRDAFKGFTDYALRQLQEDAPQGVQYRKGTDGLPMRRDSAEFKRHEQDLESEAGANPARRTTTVNALQYLREEITPNNQARAREAMLRRLQERDIKDRIAAGTDEDAAYEAVKNEVSRFGEDAYLAKHYVFRTDDRSYEERGLSDKDWESLRATGKAMGSNNITVMRDGKPTVVNPVAVSMLGQRSLEGSYKGIDNATVARFFAEGMSLLINDPAVSGFSDAKGNAVQFTDKMDIAPNTVVYVRNGEPVTYGDIAPLINKPTPEQAKTNAARDKEKNPPYERGKYSHLFDNSLLAGEEDIAQLLDEVNGALAEKRESALKLSKKVDFVVRAGKRAKRAGRKEERDALAAEYRELKSSYDKLTGFISRLEDRAFELESGDLDMIARGNLEREQGGSVDNDSADGESTRYKNDTASAIVGRETGYETDPGARNEKFVGRPLKEQPTKEMLEAQRLDALRRKGPEGARALIDFAWRTLADGDGNRNPDQVMRSVRNTAAKYYSPAAVDRAIEISEDLPQGVMRAAVQDGLEEARAIWNERSDDLAKQVRDAGRDATRPTEAPYNKRLPPPHTMTAEQLHDEMTAGPSEERWAVLREEAAKREMAARNGEDYEPRPHTPVDKVRQEYKGESPTLGTTPVEQMSAAELRNELRSVDQFLTDTGFNPTGDARYDAAQKKLSARYSEVLRELQHRGRTRAAQAAQEAADARNAPRATEAPYTGEQPVRSMTTEELRTELDWLEEGLADAGEASEVKRVPGLTMAEQARYDDLRRELDAREGPRGPMTSITYEAGHTAPYAGDYGAAKPTPERKAPDYTAARKLTTDLAAALKGDVKPVEFIKGMSKGELQQVRDTLQALKPGLRRNAFLKVVTDALNGPNDDGSGGGKAKAAPAKKTDDRAARIAELQRGNTLKSQGRAVREAAGVARTLAIGELDSAAKTASEGVKRAIEALKKAVQGKDSYGMHDAYSELVDLNVDDEVLAAANIATTFTAGESTLAAAQRVVRRVLGDDVEVGIEKLHDAAGVMRVFSLDDVAARIEEAVRTGKSGRDAFNGPKIEIILSDTQEFGAFAHTLHHEIAHGIITKLLADPKHRKLAVRMVQAVHDPEVLKQVARHYRHDPDTLAYMNKNPEELFANTYALFVAGRLNLGRDTFVRRVLDTLGDMIVRFLGRIKDDRKFLHVAMSAMKYGHLRDVASGASGATLRNTYVARLDMGFLTYIDGRTTSEVVFDPYEAGYDDKGRAGGTLETSIPRAAEVLSAYGTGLAVEQKLREYPKLEKAYLEDLLEARSKLVSGNATREDVVHIWQTDNAVEELTLEAVDDVMDAEYEELPAGDKQFSKQAPSGQGAREKFVRDYLRRVFGDEPKAVFSDTFGFAGSYDRDGDFFEFSLHAPLGTEAHEALHRWFKKLQDSNDPGAQEMIKTIIKAATSEHTMARLRELLKDHPDALKQLSDPEEAAAYAFQFYSYGLLKLESAPAKGFFGKIAAAVKRFLKIASDEQRTQQFFDYFSQGKWAADKRPSVVAQVVRDSYSASSKVRWARQQLAPLGEATSKLFLSAADRLENTEVPALKQLGRLFKAEVGDDGGMGFLQRAVNTRNRWVNTYAKAVKGLSDKQKANVLAFVRGEEVAGGMTAEESAAVKTVRSLFAEVYDHAQKRGVPLKRRANYFPRVWDAEKIRAKQDDFVNMLVGKYGFSTDDAHRVRATLQTGANDHVVNESPEDPGYNPFFSAVNERKLPDMDAEDIKPFLETSLDGIMARYLQQASKRIEYEAKFGAKGERIHAMLERAKRQGASEEDLATAKSSVMAMEGTMPVTLSSRWQTFNDVMVTYQNVRLLPLSILVQATDAIGIAARSGSMNNAWQAFKQGIKDVPKWRKKNPKLNEWDQVAVAMGVLEDTALEDVSQTYFNTQTSGMARTINDKFFKWFLMDGWNKSMRVMATKTATEFIAEHAAGKNEHSARMLKELGLTQAQAKAMLDKDGKLVLDPSNEQQREAIFRFVDQAVIRANPADRTVWGSDPRFAVLQHLKQYTYSFHRNILAHAKHEASEGNWAPVQMLATYVPVMAAGMYVRALAGNGGELPEYMEQWGFWDWVWNAFDRSGIAGLYNYHLWDLPGPTVTQAANAVKASQRGTLGAELAEAVPGHQFASML